jgi:NADH-quinone oxidoreductase subunit H
MDVSTLITILAVFGGLQAVAGGLVYVERKVCAFMQNRIGPNRVGPVGILQVLADGIKFILKEEFVPKYADRVLFIAAPAIGMVAAMLSFAVVPFGATDDPSKAADYASQYQFIIAKNIDIGILFIFAVSSLTVYGIILGGWASNNKYSLLGGLRSSAQIISYEIPLGLSVLGVVLMTGSLNLERIIWHQATSHWNIWWQPLAFILFMISAFAECNRLPFDLPETEQELVGGYHTEYNAMKLAFFFVGEYTHMITTSFLMVILFFGGWDLPFAGPDMWWGLKLLVMLAKVSVFILFYMLVRWTIPRFRFDQLMALAWKVFIPMALVNLVAVMFVKEFAKEQLWILTIVSIVVLIAGGFALSQPAARPRRVAI